MAPIVVVSQHVGAEGASGAGKEDKAHHKQGGGFVNPWESFKELGMGPSVLWNMRKDWVSRPVPPPESLPPVVSPVFTAPASLSPAEAAEWRKDIKATWLGHACFLVEFPSAKEGERGLRVLFDPVWSHRCSPSQWIGPARIQPPPITLEQIPQVDAVLDVATLKHLYKQPKGSIHFFAPLGNATWFKSVIGVKDTEVTEMDWWDERKLSLGEGPKDTNVQEQDGAASLRVRCTPCQHFSGRTLTDRNDTLWASWVVESSQGGKVWFGGDTGYRSVPRGYDPSKEDELPVCPAFEEIGQREGAFDFAMIPIGAYSPRWFMSRIHCSPEDSVEVHRHIKSRKSIGMHWDTWMLTDEPMDEPPKRLRTACEKYGIDAQEFGICDLGETVRIKPATGEKA
ncbi:Protein-lysine N-methyltransferase efm4 [Rhodosporidiobolus nylandii]